MWWLGSVVVHGRERAGAHGPVAVAVPTLREVSLLAAVRGHAMEAGAAGAAGVTPFVRAHEVRPLWRRWKDITLKKQRTTSVSFYITSIIHVIQNEKQKQRYKYTVNKEALT